MSKQALALFVLVTVLTILAAGTLVAGSLAAGHLGAAWAAIPASAPSLISSQAVHFASAGVAGLGPGLDDPITGGSGGGY